MHGDIHKFDPRVRGPFAERHEQNPVQAVGLARRAVNLGDRLILLDDARAQIAQELLVMYEDSGNERIRIEALKAGVRELRLLRADWLKDADRTEKASRRADDAGLKMPATITPDNAGQAAEALRAGVSQMRGEILSKLNDRKNGSEEDHTVSSLPLEGGGIEGEGAEHTHRHLR